ncbi:MAG: FAD binding domain-containing protein [Treponema sp.]|nr:FAD binding domain-containing protein [Treponema sp.]
MAGLPEPVLSPETYAELFADWGRHPDALPFAGGTALIRGRPAPGAILSLDKIEEMRRINRSERYLEIGAMVKLSRIIELRKFGPGVLVHCIRNIAGPQIRNMATIGGNVCGHLDSVAAFTALDAQYELRSAQSSRWITAARFSPGPGPGALGQGEILSRIRVPLDNWDYSAYKKFAGRNAVFLARAQKNVLADIRIICKAADRIWRDRDSEMFLAGKRLPLPRRTAAAFVGRWEAFLRGAGNMDEPSRREFVNFIDANVDNLVE